MKTKNLLYYALPITALLCFIIYGLIQYLISEGRFTKESFAEFMTSWGWPIIILVIVAIAGFFIMRWKMNKNKLQEREIPKEIIDNVPALKVWKEQFIVETGIPYYTKFDKNDKPEICLINQGDLEIHNEKPYIDQRTGIPFIFFEALVQSGRRMGNNVVGFRKDRGIDFIKNNWNTFIRERTSSELVNPKRENLTAIEEENARIDLIKFEMKEDGFTNRQMKEMDDFKIKAKNDYVPEVNPEIVEAHVIEKQLDQAVKLKKLQESKR